MNPRRLLNEVGVNYSAYRIRSFLRVLTQHLMEPSKYANWTLLLRLWAPDGNKADKMCLEIIMVVFVIP